MARKKAPSYQGAVWTTKDFATMRRLVKTGATGKTIAEAIGRSVVALSESEYRGYLAVGAPGGSAIGRSQEGESRRRIDEATFPLNV